MKRTIILSLSLLAATLTASAGDPYAELATYDYGKDTACVYAIGQIIRDSKPADYPAIEQKLLGALAGNASYGCKKAVADCLRIVGSKASVPAMLKLLSDSDTRCNDLARLALQGINDPAVGQALAGALKTAQGHARIGLVRTLAVRRDKTVVGDIAGFVTSDDATLSRASIEALAAIGTKKALGALQQAKVAEALAGVREQAIVDCAWQLVRDGDKAAAKPVFQTGMKSTIGSVTITSLNGLVEIDPDNAIDLVVATMKDSRPTVGVRAAHAALNLKGSEATKKLCAALPTLPAPVQVALLRSLGDRGDKAALAAVKAAIENSDEAVQIEAITASLPLGDTSVLPLLVPRATKTGPVADAAAMVLGRINVAGADDMLVKMLDDQDKASVRIAAAALAARGYRAAVPRLLKLAADKDDTLREAACKSLSSLAGLDQISALMTLLQKADSGERKQFVNVLWDATAAAGENDARFLRLWNNAPSDSVVRVALMPVAASAAGPESLKTVKQQLTASDNEVKDAAHRALFAWQNESAAPTILEVLKSTDNRTYRVLAARALASRLTDKKCKLSQKERVDILTQAMDRMDRPEDKSLLQAALGKLGAKAPVKK